MEPESLHHLLATLLGEDLPGDPVAPLLDALVAVTGFECVYLTRVDQARNEQRVLVSRRLAEHGLVIPAGTTEAWSDSLCRHVFERGAEHVPHVDQQWPDNRFVQEYGVRSFVSLPVVDQYDALRGTLCLASRGDIGLGGDALVLVRLFAQAIGYQVEREAQIARAHRECRNQSQRAIADALAALAAPEALRVRLAGSLRRPPSPEAVGRPPGLSAGQAVVQAGGVDPLAE